MSNIPNLIRIDPRVRLHLLQVRESKTDANPTTITWARGTSKQTYQQITLVLLYSLHNFLCTTYKWEGKNGLCENV